MKPLNIGIVGCGRIAAAHLQAIEALPHLRLAAVSDSNSTAAQQLAAHATHDRPRIFACHEDMADAIQLDAVIICTPPITHPSLATDLLRCGVHVLCEKPLAVSVVEAREMYAVANEQQKILMMASKFRFAHDILEARRMIEAGTIGSPVYCRLGFCAPVNMTGRWNAEPALSGGGVLMDNGPHAADIMRFLFGPIRNVQARHGQRIQPLAVEDTTHLCFETNSGVLGHVDLSWSIAAPSDDYLQISGTQGAIAVGWQRSQWRSNHEREWRTFGGGYDKQQAFVAQFDQFAACIRGEDAVPVSPEAAMASVEVVVAAYQSAEQKQWMAVERSVAVVR